MSDPAPSPSERLAERSSHWLGAFGQWHPVTRLVVIAGLLHLSGDILNWVSAILRNGQTGYWMGMPLETVGGWLIGLGYTLTFFGTAATVEFLVRIWREIVLLRKAREASGG